MDSGIAKFQDFIAVREDNMVVLLILESPFKQSAGLTKLMFADKITIDQQIDGIVERCPGNPVLFVFHAHIQGFDVEMPAVIINFSKNSKPFRCFPVFV